MSGVGAATLSRSGGLKNYPGENMHKGLDSRASTFLNPQFQLRTKSPKHYVLPRNLSGIDNLLINTPDVVPTKWPPSLRILSSLLYIYGIRISEALSINYSHVNPDGFIWVRSKKGSHDRIIYFPAILILCGHPKCEEDSPVFNVSYRQYYSHLRRAGISGKSRPGKKNESVTHLFRVSRINTIKREYPVTAETIQLFTAHKSIKSLDYYLGKSAPVIATQPKP